MTLRRLELTGRPTRNYSNPEDQKTWRFAFWRTTGSQSKKTRIPSAELYANHSDPVFGGKVCSKWRIQLPQAGLAGQIRQLRRKRIMTPPPFENGVNTACYVSDPEK